jgi:glucose-1-phosphate adenylyltransferase
VSGALLRRSLLFSGVRVNSFTEVEDTVVLPHVEIGRSVRIRRAVIDRGVHIPEGMVIGEDPEEDARRFRRTEKGICLVTRPMIERLQN